MTNIDRSARPSAQSGEARLSAAIDCWIDDTDDISFTVADMLVEMRAARRLAAYLWSKGYRHGDSTEGTLPPVDPLAAISQERRDMIEAVVNGNTPMEPWQRHTGITTFDDLMQWAERQLRETLTLRSHRDHQNNGVPPKDDLEDYLIGKESVLVMLLANMRQISERAAIAPRASS